IDGTGLKPDIQVLTPGLSLAIAYAYLNGNSESSIIIDRDKDEVMVNGFAIGNGRVIQLQGKTYLPLRLLFESLGYRVDWLPGEGAVRATKYQSEVFFYPGRGYYIVNGQTYPAVASVLSIEGNVYIQESLLTLFNAGVRYEGSAVIIEEKL
ncbi:MAG: stalk domain-containing protein, partial [Desulfotomaculaceae bacterium]|nr:stalk domain-containing protein [Desulfotomaculaceae bacterium]